MGFRRTGPERQARRGRGWIGLALGLALAGACAAADWPEEGRQDLDTALAIEAPSRASLAPGPATGFAAESARPVALPDDWAVSRPAHDGFVRYRLAFPAPTVGSDEGPPVLWIARACGLVEASVNGHLLLRRTLAPGEAARGCASQSFPLPDALLDRAGRNVVDLTLAGAPLRQLAAREFAAGLSRVSIGAGPWLETERSRQSFWSVTWPQSAAAVLFALGTLLFLVAWQNRHEVYFGYLGAVCVVSAAFLLPWSIADALGWREPRCTLAVGLATLGALAVQFLLGYTALRSRLIEALLVVQWLLVPASLVALGRDDTFELTMAWAVIIAAETLAVAVLCLVRLRRSRPHDFAPLFASAAVAALLVSEQFMRELGRVDAWPQPAPPMALAMPFVVAALSVHLLLMFARALRASLAARVALADRVHELTEGFEENLSQVAGLRVAHVAEKERKRIAADLHDDLGAKLLTIVHTSANERTTVLAREALDDMRLAVKGLMGKSMPLADALADWRAEIVARLGEAGIEIDWQMPAEETAHRLSARIYVQVTRILREAVSNVVKHSGASACTMRCRVDDDQLLMRMRDNGRGIPVELEGMLDRGLGMASMKRRAKQISGQCLVQSGPGYGTVIALTLPLRIRAAEALA